MCPPMSSIMSCVCVSACLLFSIDSDYRMNKIKYRLTETEGMSQPNEEVDVRHEGRKKKTHTHNARG